MPLDIFTVMYAFPICFAVIFPYSVTVTISGLLDVHSFILSVVFFGSTVVVKDDGQLVCYHLYNEDAFKDYLFNNTKFDTPSSTRHNFGTIYKHNGGLFINLNLHIRFVR